MRRIYLAFILAALAPCFMLAQFSSTAAGGNWTANGSWAGGTSPGTSTSSTVTVIGGSTVNYNANLTFTGTASVTVNGFLTDAAGGTNYTLTMSNFAELHVYGEMTVGGAVTVSNSCRVHVHGCGTLTVGDLTLSNNSVLVVDSCATLIVTGNLVLNNNNASTINGAVQVSGNVTGNNNATVAGTGSIVADGSITSNNGSSFFGNSGTNCANTATPCFAGGGIIGPLPIELLYFTAESYEGDVLLKWATATEENNDYFTIERSEDGFNFSPVAEIQSAAANGNSITTLYYSAIDEDPLPGVSYYRLKQTDFNLNYSYSNVVVAEALNDTKSIRVYPNPAKDILNIEVKTPLDELDGEVRIHNIFGEVLFKSSEKFVHGRCKLVLPHLSAGSYFLEVNCGTHSLHEKIVVE